MSMMLNTLEFNYCKKQKEVKHLNGQFTQVKGYVVEQNITFKIAHVKT